jgi:integrase
VPKVTLTSAFVRSIRCPLGKRKIDYFDTTIPGFLVEVRQSGGRTYYQRYRTPHGVERQYKIGPTSLVSLSQARRKAKAIAAFAVLGGDPQSTRAELRQMPVFAQFLMNEYLPFAKANKRSWRTDLAVLRTHIIPCLGRLHLDEVTPQAVVGLIDIMQAKGYATGTTNRVLILLRRTFNLAIQWGIPGAAFNPTKGLKTAPDVQRERFLSSEEILRLRVSLQSDQNQLAASAIKLLLLTGARRNEITQARWTYVDWSARRLKVPLSKTGRARWVELNPQALEVLRSVPPRVDNPYIFPSPATGRPCPSLHFPWLRIKKRAGLEGLRLDDLRHTYASLLANDGVPLYTVQNLLGHTHARATQRYAHLSDETLSNAADVVGKIVGSL